MAAAVVRWRRRSARRGAHAADCVMASASTSASGRGEPASGGRGCLSLSLAALGCGGLEWLGTGTCCEGATAAGCAGGCSPSLPRCCYCSGATVVVGLGVAQALAGGSGVGLRAAPDLFQQGRCRSGRERATATTGIVLSGLVLIRAKAFIDVVSGDGGGAHWVSLFPAGGWAPLFPAGGTIAGHQTIVALELGVKTLSVRDV
jgi:hypothetical protein